MLRATFLCLMLLSMMALPGWSEQVRLFLVHTNDLHGHVEASSGQVEAGGFVRIATVIRTLKAAFPDQVLVFDAGDFGLGTPTSGLFQGVPTAQAMASVGYDAIAIGNHEFNWGQQAMARMLEATQAPTLCANLVKESDGSHPYPPSVVLERRGVRLGLIGLVAPDTGTRAPRAHLSDLAFLPAEPAARTALAALPPVDAVIALTHLGEREDRALARAIPELDLIVGGHSHTALAEVVTENGVPIVQAGAFSQYVGLLEILIDTEQDDLEVLSYRLLPVGLDIAPDPQVGSLIEGYAAQLRPVLDKEIGFASSEVLNVPGAGGLDRPLGNLIADMLRTQTGADFALYNRGGVRGTLAAGPLTVRQLHELFPFDDPVVVLQARGDQLPAILEQGAQTQARLSLSGMQVTLTRSGALIAVEGRPLQPDRLYTVATTGFLASGGDNMSTLAGLQVTQRLGFTREVVQQYLEQNPQVSPPASGRITRRDEG